jgi:hypothetical protein
MALPGRASSIGNYATRKQGMETTVIDGRGRGARHFKTLANCRRQQAPSACRREIDLLKQPTSDHQHSSERAGPAAGLRQQARTFIFVSGSPGTPVVGLSASTPRGTARYTSLAHPPPNGLAEPARGGPSRQISTHAGQG